MKSKDPKSNKEIAQMIDSFAESLKHEAAVVLVTIVRTGEASRERPWMVVRTRFANQGKHKRITRNFKSDRGLSV